MIPGDGGRVIPNRDISGGGNVSINAPITVYPQSGWSEADGKALQETIERTAMRIVTHKSQRPGGILQPRRK
ncbi:hypothetical protein ACLB1N_34260 [Escherichia coli]